MPKAKERMQKTNERNKKLSPLKLLNYRNSLFKAKLKYQKLAAKYGVRTPSDHIHIPW